MCEFWHLMILVETHSFCLTLDLQLSFYRLLCYNSRARCPLLQCLSTTSAILAGAHSYFVVSFKCEGKNSSHDLIPNPRIILVDCRDSAEHSSKWSASISITVRDFSPDEWVITLRLREPAYTNTVWWSRTTQNIGLHYLLQSAILIFPARGPAV